MMVWNRLSFSEVHAIVFNIVNLLVKAFEMRKFIPLFIIFVLLTSGFTVMPNEAGSDKSQTILLQESQLSNVFTFEQLGYSEKLMVGPFDSSGLRFSLPANIKLATGSSILLKYAIALSGGSESAATPVTNVGGTLLVYFNDELIDTIILD